LLLSYVRLTSDALSRLEFILATMAIISGLAFWTWADFTDATAEAETKLSSAALAMDELALRSLLGIDIVLASVISRAADQGLDKLRTPSEKDRLKRIASRLPETGAVFIADKTGDVIAASVSFEFRVNVSDREWFKALLSGKTEPYVGRAIRGRSIHTYFFPVARAIREPGGDFLGAAQVGVEVTYVERLFRSLDVGQGAQLGLYRTEDGAVVARYPMAAELLDETVTGLRYFPTLAAEGAESWTGWVANGGSRNRSGEQLVSARRLNGWPLIVTVSLPKGQIYARAWWHLISRAVVAAFLIAALLALTALAVRQARREKSLMRELQHRVKNMLAEVTAMVDRAHEGSRSSEEFISSLRGRLRSMVATQALVEQRNRQGVDLATLIRGELAPYATPDNCHVDGPRVHLEADEAHVLGLTFHELATNAAKYGALSRTGGRVSVRWTLQGIQAPLLTIQWEESGGPEVGVPARLGYGSEVIREFATYELGATVDLVFAPAGIRCVIQLPDRALG
jgi:two-component sensor histidine kinase